jgi:outer membrane protein TolC
MTPELPRAGDSSPGERTDTRTPDGSGDSLSLAEAAERFEVSRATLKRRLGEGKIPGAFKQPTVKGDAWRIPTAALSGLYGRRETPADPPAPPAPAVSPGALEGALTRLIETLDSERLMLQAAEADRRDARVEAATLAAQLEAERDLRRRAEAELEHLRSAGPASAPPPKPPNEDRPAYPDPDAPKPRRMRLLARFRGRS